MSSNERRNERKARVASRRPGKGRATSGPLKKAWALLAYIAGDNDLSEAGLKDIQELCDEGASKDVHVGVEIDTYGDHTGSIRYEITEPDWAGQAHRKVIERLPEKDSGDPDTLRSFLDWGLRRYPADSRLVVVWNHGAGFRRPRRNIAYDDFGSSLDMPEIESAFRRAGVNRNNRIAILGFDACLMNMLEIVNHLRDQAEIIVGSQQTEPGDGWPYDQVLRLLKGSPSAARAARSIVKAYIDDYRSYSVGDVTQSAVATDNTEPAVATLSRLGSALASCLPTIRAQIRQIRLVCQTFAMADYVDLIHLADLIRSKVSDSQVQSASSDLRRDVRGAVIASDTHGDVVRNANGLSVWFPSTGSLYSAHRPKYLALRCVNQNFGWLRFLDAYHS